MGGHDDLKVLQTPFACDARLGNCRVELSYSEVLAAVEAQCGLAAGQELSFMLAWDEGARSLVWQLLNPTELLATVPAHGKPVAHCSRGPGTSSGSINPAFFHPSRKSHV